MNTNLPQQLFIGGWRFRWFQFRALMRAAILSFRVYPKPSMAWRALGGMLHKNRLNNRYRNLSKAVAVGGRTFFMMSVSGFPGAGLDTMLRNELLRSRPLLPFETGLNLIFISFTKKCSMQCAHCCEWDTLHGRDVLSPDDWAAIVRKFQAIGLSNIEIGGGEPLNRYADLIAFLQKSDTAASDFWLATNGFFMTNEKAKALKSAGLTGVSVSLDHWDAEAHDRFRGTPGAFVRACQAVKSVHNAGLVSALTLVPTRDFCTLENLHRYLALARELNAGFVRILEPRASGRWESQVENELEPRHWQVLESFHREVQYGPQYRNYPILEYHGAHQRQVGCGGAGERYLFVDNDGFIHPCPFCRQAFGSALTDEIRPIIQKMRQGAACQAYSRIEQLVLETSV